MSTFSQTIPPVQDSRTQSGEMARLMLELLARAVVISGAIAALITSALTLF